MNHNPSTKYPLMTSTGHEARLHSPDLEANVMELVDCMGFHLLSHVPSLVAHLRVGDTDLMLLQDRGEEVSSSQKIINSRAQLFVTSIFDLYVKLARKLRYRLSGPPRLSPRGHWEFSVSDSFGHSLCFTQAAKTHVFSLGQTTKLSRNKTLGESH